MGDYVYPSLKSRIKTEYKIYILALLFIAVADSAWTREIYFVPDFLFPDFGNPVGSAGNKSDSVQTGKGSIKAGHCGNLSIYRKAWH